MSNGACNHAGAVVDPSPKNAQSSGVDNVRLHEPPPRATLEMFLPPHEVAQVLSYPGNFVQLEAEIAGLQLQTWANPPLWPQQSTDTTSVQWAGEFDEWRYPRHHQQSQV